MKNLNITVANKVATYCQRDGFIVCGNNDYQITFTFDSEWDAITVKTARFKWNGGHIDVILEGNTAKVPTLSNTERVEVGVFAEGLCTTTPAYIPCEKSILCDTFPEVITVERALDLEARIAALKLYRHVYTIRLNDYENPPYASVKAVLYSHSAQSLKTSSDFLQTLRDKATLTLTHVSIADNEDGERVPASVDLLSGGKFMAYYYTDIVRAKTGYVSTANYTVTAETITEV